MKLEDLWSICDDSAKGEESYLDSLSLDSSVFSGSLESQGLSSFLSEKAAISNSFEVLSFFDGKDDRSSKEIQSVSSSPWARMVSVVGDLDTYHLPSDLTLSLQELSSFEGLPSTLEYSLSLISENLELNGKANKLGSEMFKLLESTSTAALGGLAAFNSQHSLLGDRDSFSDKAFRLLKREVDTMRSSSAVVLQGLLRQQKTTPRPPTVEDLISDLDALSFDDLFGDLESAADILDGDLDQVSKPISLLRGRGPSF